MDAFLLSQQFVVAGLGLTGQSVIRFLLESGASVKVWDTRESADIPNTVTVPVSLGTVPTTYWQNVDTLVLSPGISPFHPCVVDAREQGVDIIGDVELFARINRAPVLAITGSNGKTTVTQLTSHILNACRGNVCAAGNVGKPVLDTLGEHWDMLVLELSSFQLESTYSLNALGATILNITDDHLDRHGTMAAYAAAKQRIYRHSEYAVIWRGHGETYPVNGPLADKKSQWVSVGLDLSSTDFGYADNHITWQGEAILNMNDVALVGQHNILNIQVALALCVIAGVEPSEAAMEVGTFKPAPHRCVEVAHTRGVRWIDDSKATNIGATLAALEGLSNGNVGKLILIAGGDGKGADFSVLKGAFSKYVDVLITMGKDGKAMADLLPGAHYVHDMQAAVSLATEYATAGDIVLLSPACASIDMFDNYMHRGQVFAQAIGEVSGT
ncbi:UDP-N-acetylmuramoyl-L-alanine--D-glutamate ligase [Aestuariibacter sp. A3R04]|uniref:UDP-N-acetylmuramoyl-L-alanine--D-glutamate ligase n=1 Tax=Aestuariibacter sp. A3R04 TaxID=2841571 RepID=UPI001C0A4645|nr:UDP-N-acetylmuramoyl-L-alanine--D-glutamate ligase [Aestuariibacter sp. A3R04]MBU3021533.1 UDP-N-acetylmuramoyl-L-alanine--D-glutamate ligase [Aestuariibacter sp. A3R04]